jgi:hypothetical protein
VISEAGAVGDIYGVAGTNDDYLIFCARGIFGREVEGYKEHTVKAPIDCFEEF